MTWMRDGRAGFLRAIAPANCCSTGVEERFQRSRPGLLFEDLVHDDGGDEHFGRAIGGCECRHGIEQPRQADRCVRRQ